MIYKHSEDGKYRNDSGEEMPDHVTVTASKLELGSIIFTYTPDWTGMESAAVSGLEKVNGRWKVTYVFESGKIETRSVTAGSACFYMQCSKEAANAALERNMHVVIRRKLQSLRDEIESGRNELERRVRDDRPTNPKLKDYVRRFSQFAVDIQAMYDEIGRDLDIGQPKPHVTKGNT